MEKRELQPGDLLQFDPAHEVYGGQIVMVTEPKSFGCQGVLFLDREYQNLTRYKGRAFIRPTFEEVEYVGRIEWMFQDDDEDSD